MIVINLNISTDSSQRKNGSLENSPEKMFGPMLPTSLDQTTLLKEFVSREVDSIIQHVLAKGNGQSSNGKVEGIILRPSQTVTGDGPKEDGALMVRTSFNINYSTTISMDCCVIIQLFHNTYKNVQFWL